MFRGRVVIMVKIKLPGQAQSNHLSRNNDRNSSPLAVNRQATDFRMFTAPIYTQSAWSAPKKKTETRAAEQQPQHALERLGTNSAPAPNTAESWQSAAASPP